MNEWMNEWMNERMNELLDAQMNEWQVNGKKNRMNFSKAYHSVFLVRGIKQITKLDLKKTYPSVFW